MSISTRNRRGSVYVYSSAAAAGYVTQRYTLLNTYNCRISIESAGERTVAAQAEHGERAVIEFDSAVVIGMNDIIVENGVQWRVESVITRRSFHSKAKIVRAFRVDDDVYLSLLLYNGQTTYGGAFQHSGYVNALQSS